MIDFGADAESDPSGLLQQQTPSPEDASEASHSITYTQDEAPIETPTDAGAPAQTRAIDDSLSSSYVLDFGSIDCVADQLLDAGLELPLASRVPLTAWPFDDDQPLNLPTQSQPVNSRESFSSAASSDVESLRSGAIELFRHIPRSPSASDDGPDATLRLINNWFEQVCPAWSAFDSSMNLNRKLANDLWHSSASVFNSLQSMSASFLSARLPQMRRPAHNLLRTATECIQSEVNVINSRAQFDSLPTGLLFSLLCLGTTICWLDASRVGAPFLRQAKSLLDRISKQYVTTDDEQLELLAFFNKSLVYWEMLVSVVDDEDLRSDTDRAALDYPQQLEAPLRPPQMMEHPIELSTDLLPHPWTGISSFTQRLFSRTMRLCRTYRRRITKPTGRAISLSTAMQEIEEAQRLEEQLLELEFSSMTSMNDTGDWKTPWLHLASVAEAYQLSSLLQLYVTFPDLVSLRLPQESDGSPEGDVPWDKWIIPLTLRLIGVLEQIPPDSGSRVIQPLLYICASTGLRYSLSSPPSNNSQPWSLHHMGRGSEATTNSLDILGYIEQVAPSDDASEADVESVPQVAMDVGNGRNFIMSRLNVLESTLQPKPIIVAQELVKAIWSAYDEEAAGSTSTHWLDVMENKDLRSLFG